MLASGLVNESSDLRILLAFDSQGVLATTEARSDAIDGFARRCAHKIELCEVHASSWGIHDMTV